MAEIVPMQSLYCSMQEENRISSYDIEVLTGPTTPLIHPMSRFWLINSGKGTLMLNNRPYEGQGAMRGLVKKSTCVICLATMLHTIATGNMTPSFRVMPDGTIRPVYLYTVDADEFVVNKLLDRGSLCATTVVTNVQDFITIVAKALKVIR